ncbi:MULTISPECIES: class I SAM-dependent RNA methyltransferase [unclassified Microbacterium]|uniref:class I SAM-dependent RNA methyltransferase n=1 Tax=unclassified Microbacterium TaxID=2609290 RepID=UPI000EA9EB96|nr:MULTISPECIES: TRAM domain-containing protein [unclassified Microbacterium]MBT2486772.1 class I SAM-dependent RNA methyltransferase [Microbacterium sp. ISL-108]RKN64700.1 class I SAM-dependent RNA methyltransferase [Microbacterium sp. CGR2]
MTSSADVLELDITGIAHGGTFIARHEGRVVFVSDAIPGERVRARLIDPSEGSGSSARTAPGPADTRSFWRAETVEVLDASPHRRAHIWPEADVSRDPSDRPGGADLGHIDLTHQRTLKKQVLTEALDRFAGPGLEAPEIEAVESGDGLGWRTRVTLHVDDDGRVGPYAARSHRVVPVKSHPLARPAVAAAALELRGGAAGRVDLVEPADGEVRIIRHEDGARPAQRGGRRVEPEVVEERVGDRRFQVDVGGFWQVHPRAASVLDAAVYGVLDGHVDAEKTHYDLYGGVGLFAATLADLGATDIVTVESSKRATHHAQANLAPLKVTAVTARVDRFLKEISGRTGTGTVVLDPPRAGAGRAVVEAVHALAPEAIAYVACDPVALARDLGTFRALGWQVPTLRGFDLFPHSHHFEVVALLTR